MKNRSGSASKWLILILIAVIIFAAVAFASQYKGEGPGINGTTSAPTDGIPAYSGSPYAFINGNTQ